MSEYVRVACTKCEAAVKVETDSLGEWVTCPKCDKDFVAKEPRANAKPTAKPVPRRDEDEEEDDRPRRKSRRDEEEDEDDRPRKKSRNERPGKGPGGDFAFGDDSDEDEDEDDRPRRKGPRPGVCPGCGSRRSSKVTYTWWGGLVGPAIFGLVKCGKCQKQYMGGSGKPLGAVQIIVYSLVVGAIGLAVGAVVVMAAK